MVWFGWYLSNCMRILFLLWANRKGKYKKKRFIVQRFCWHLSFNLRFIEHYCWITLTFSKRNNIFFFIFCAIFLCIRDYTNPHFLYFYSIYNLVTCYFIVIIKELHTPGTPIKCNQLSRMLRYNPFLISYR